MGLEQFPVKLGGRCNCDECILFQPMEVYVDDEAKLTLHGLQQHYVKLKDAEKNRKLFELLDVLEFNQVRLLPNVHMILPKVTF